MTIEHRPRARVLVAPGVAHENQLPDSAFDISGHVFRVRSTKTLASPNGTFEFHCIFRPLSQVLDQVERQTIDPGFLGPPAPYAAVADERTLNEVLVPENIVDIAFDRGVKGSRLTDVMQGTISKVETRETVDAAGRVTRELLVSGHDWGKLLVGHELSIYEFTLLVQGPSEVELREQRHANLQGSVGKVSEDLFTLVFRDQLTREGSVFSGLILRDLYVMTIDQELFDEKNGWILTDTVWTRQGKFWNQLRGLADDPWNELYADWAEDIQKFEIVLRRRQFDEDLWMAPDVVGPPAPDAERTTALKMHEITDEETIYIDCHLADNERVNWVLVPPSGILQSTTSHSPEYLSLLVRRADKQSMEAHGSHLLKRASAFVDLPNPGGGSLMLEPKEADKFAASDGALWGNCDRRAQRLWDWYSINHRLWTGTIIVNGRPDIRIGSKLRQASASTWLAGESQYFVEEESTRRDYYVEQVIHDYIDGQHFFTHLGVTRGQPRGEFLRPATDGKIATEQGAR